METYTVLGNDSPLLFLMDLAVLGYSVVKLC